MTRDQWLSLANIPPGGFYDTLLRRLSNPRRHRWRCYLHACKQVPPHSPVHGSTSWQRLNNRRGELIDRKFGDGLTPEEEVEYTALQNVCDAVVHGYAVAQLFVLSRIDRRLRQQAKNQRELP